MAAPDPNMATSPAGAVMAVLMAWDDAESKYRGVTMSGGKLETMASVSASDGPSTGAITSVPDAAVSTTILAANASRKGATVFNDSTAVLYLALAAGTASATVYSVQIPAGGYYELPLNDGGVYTGILVGIWASDAGGSARVTELV